MQLSGGHFFMAVSSIPTAAQTQPLLTIAGVTISALKDSSVFFFKAGMAVDADGAPTAYHPNPHRGLDNLANAGHEGDWWGIVTDNGKANGKPIVQGPNDPAPGFYISKTALENKHLASTNPSRYVDSRTIPYISLPGHHGRVLRAQPGDLAMVINIQNGNCSAAIFADIGPQKKIGEGSIALAGALGLNQNARHGGCGSRSIIYIVFPHSGINSPLSGSDIYSRGNRLFETWGGMKQASACFPELGSQLKRCEVRDWF
jgi:hypothetical protein